jgi:hypothetical protein
LPEDGKEQRVFNFIARFSKISTAKSTQKLEHSVRTTRSPWYQTSPKACIGTVLPMVFEPRPEVARDDLL